MTNWKTTAAGLGLAFLNLFVAAVTTGISPKDAALSAGLGVLGLVAKDHDVTGTGFHAQRPQ